GSLSYTSRVLPTTPFCWIFIAGRRTGGGWCGRRKGGEGPAGAGRSPWPPGAPSKGRRIGDESARFLATVPPRLPGPGRAGRARGVVAGAGGGLPAAAPQRGVAPRHHSRPALPPPGPGRPPPGAVRQPGRIHRPRAGPEQGRGGGAPRTLPLRAP